MVLANLSGFDGSPESLRNVQLENGAEIGRAIVNFDGPSCSSWSPATTAARSSCSPVRSTRTWKFSPSRVRSPQCSVGHPPLRGVHPRREQAHCERFAHRRARSQIAAAEDGEKARLGVELASVRTSVRSEKLGEVAAEFEAIHNIQRAQQVGSVDAIVPAAELRPQIIAAVERGIARTSRNAS